MFVFKSRNDGAQFLDETACKSWPDQRLRDPDPLCKWKLIGVDENTINEIEIFTQALVASVALGDLTVDQLNRQLEGGLAYVGAQDADDIEEELLIALAALDNAISRVARPICGLGVDRFPAGDAPSAPMPTTAPGTSIEEAEATLAQVLEEAVNNVEGVEPLRSFSSQGRAFVIATE
jgi:hypothetical protein